MIGRGAASRRRDERGAVLAIVGSLTFALLAAGALAVDLGMQRVVRSDAQAVADVVALDLARTLDGRSDAGDLERLWVAGGRLEGSLARNGSGLGYAPAAPGPDWVCTSTVCAHAVAGVLDSAGRFEASGAAEVPDAVSVEVRGRTAFGLARVLGMRSGGADRLAVGRADPGSACYQVGSFALGLASNSSILAALLGPAASARVLGYRGIATASVALGDLAAALGAGTPQQLLSASGITVGSLLTGAARVLDADGDTASAAVSAQLVGLASDLGPLAAKPVQLAGLIDLGQGGGSALEAGVDIFDLVTGALIVANGANALRVDALGLTLPGLGSLTANLFLVSPPVQACDGGVARAAQGRVELSGTLTVAGVATLKNVRLTVSLANATAALAQSEVCDPASIGLAVSGQTLANVRLTADVYAVLGLVKLGTIDTGAPGMTPTASYQLGLPASYTTPVTTWPGTLGLDLSHVTLTAAGINLGALVSGLAPLVSGVSSLLTRTLLPALGVTTAGADLWATPTRSCPGVALVG